MDIKELLESDEGKAAIASAVEEATKGLKTEKEALKEYQTKLDEQAEAKRLLEEENALKSGDADKIKQAYEDKMANLKSEYDGKLTDLDGKLHSLLVDNGLTDSLTKSGIAPEYLDAAKALIQSKHKAEVTEFDGKTIAQIEGKPLSEFITEWSQGDSGKHFKAAPNNGGGGANGTNTGGKAAGAKPDLGGDKASRTAALAQKHPELNQT
jgi:hypothetical protein